MEKKSSTISVKPFLIGGLSGCLATCVVQPIDMVKVQLQLMATSDAGAASRNPFSVASFIIKNDGISGLYKGLDAGLMRQITYTTARAGLFRVFSDAMIQYGPPKPGTTEPVKKPLPLYKKAFAGLAAGGFGSLIGNPCDLALIRMQADISLPASQKRGYTGIFNAITRIVREEGIVSLWRGSTPTVLRAMMLNAAMFASSDQTKEFLVVRMGDNLTSSLIASAVAGFCAATASLPFDFIKTQMQKMKPDPQTGQFPYKNVFDCAYKVTKKEGIMRFYSGYPVYCFRIAPHAMFTLFAIDMLSKVF